MCTMEYYLYFKKKEILPFVTKWLNQENIMPRKLGQIQKNTYCMVSLICGIKNKSIETESRMGIARV